MGFCIIQGGMGVGVSGWRLAREVSRLGQLGVVSGTGLAVMLARKLELGDENRDMRRAMAAFPVRAMVDRILERHFIPGGKGKLTPFKPIGMPQIQSRNSLVELTVVANFVEVWLAKEGHSGLVGINLLEKMQVSTLPSLYGAMLAGVDYVLMGAGIPRQIPGVLDGLAEGKAVEMRVDVEGASADEPFSSKFDPTAVLGETAPILSRPKFLAIVSSVVLAMTLARKSNGHVDGFVVEGPTAGGHNAPPRGSMVLTARGEPIYGERDAVDLEKMKELGLPFYLAGGYAEPEKLKHALAAGASGIQVGTAFAFSEESGIREEIKREAVKKSLAGETEIFTDPCASPTGFPFKVLRISGTLSEEGAEEGRERTCNMGYLRRAYLREDGQVRYRCPAEPVAAYVAKGGKAEETAGRKCLCNSLFATIGLGQVGPDGLEELPLVTAGDDVAGLGRFVKAGEDRYFARDVLMYLLGSDMMREAGVSEGRITV